jgi:ATP-dependent DNA helicase DinG
LNGTWTSDLRRWLLGTESEKRSRARGAKRRLEDLITDDEDAKKALDALMQAAQCLPAPNWRQRLRDGAPKGVTEVFLNLCRQQVQARNNETGGFYSLETGVQPPIPGLIEAASALALRLRDVQKPIAALIKHLQNRLADEAETLDTEMRERIHFAISSLNFRAKMVLGGWIEMLNSLSRPLNPLPQAGEENNGYVDWLEITRVDGHDYDIGFYRYFVDPAKIFAEQMKSQTQGVIVTSATLRDVSEDDKEGWASALTRTGIKHMASSDKPASAAGQSCSRCRRPSTTKTRHALSSSPISKKTIRTKSPQPIANCSSLPAAGRSGFSRPCSASRPCMKNFCRRSKTRASISTPSISTRSISPR